MEVLTFELPPIACPLTMVLLVGVNPPLIYDFSFSVCLILAVHVPRQVGLAVQPNLWIVPMG